MRATVQAATAAFLVNAFFHCAVAQPIPDPWEQPQDTVAALFESDRYAWRLFVALNWPAKVAAKEADAAKAFGSPGSVVWETWRNINPIAPDTVFLQNGADPGPWLGGPAVVVAKTERQFDPIPRKQEVFLAAQQRIRPGGGSDSCFRRNS